MALQQINLYLPELRPKQEWLTARTVAVSAGGLLCLLVIFYFLGVYQLQQMEQQVISLENQLVVVTNQLDSFKKKATPFQNNQVDTQLDYLRAALRGREQVGRIIEWQNLGNSEGFSLSLNTIARESSTSIALEKIALTRGGKLLELAGKIRQPEDIASYIQRLQTSPGFSGTQLGLLSVAADKNTHMHIFTLGFDPVYLSADGEN